jgi:hypothetical protein
MNKRLLAGGLLCLLAASSAQAEEPLFLAGAEIADAAYYTYLGVVVPGPGRENGRGFFQRYWIDGFGYEYDGGPGRIEAEAWGAEASLGWGSSSASGWGSVSAGIRYTDTSLSPDDPGATARGTQTGLKLQADGEYDMSPTWRVGVIASYATRQDGYWSRLRLMHRASGERSLGAEFIANGNDETDATALGLVMVMRPAGGRWSLGLKVGYRFQQDADGVYGGFEFGRSF